jgi:transcriptional regulator with XRE-family HTH domain
MKLSEKLFKVRTEKNLSKREVANRLNMDTTTYGRVEKGESSLDINKLKLLPEALGIRPEEIIELLELDKSLVFNISGDNGKGYGYVQNLNSDDKDTINEIRGFYSDLITQKDNLITQLQKEIERLRKMKEF